MGVIAAERIKLTSVKSPWWCSGIVIAIGIGFAWLMGFSAKMAWENYREIDQPGFEQWFLNPFEATLGIHLFGVTVLMILAALVVTSEYRFGVVRNTFLATNHRGKVLLAKAGITAVLAAVLTALVTVGALLLARAAAGAEAGAQLSLSGTESGRLLYAIPIYAALAMFLAVGVGAIVRQTAGAVAILLLWPLVIESIVTVLPRVGEHVGPFLPFANANLFLTGDTMPGMDNFHWGPWGGIAYFAGFVAIVFAASIALVNSRDA
ncbi:ABC transporter permease [Hoyosella subflava]|uniref:Possible ABC transporter, permease component n=1 Tax=Hoyosella subflava (strain DSM 45089 / JCM 17490 / NBRC 109087 / DQS3-9A1) TaxID=443218 RepID=F6EIS2_HOYSD|nr:ABC transporter permease [Hoyosella subflava]AEF38997.1 Possible ABC transporter, permease component [Hoyosella subflava DQS3-9A1]